MAGNPLYCGCDSIPYGPQYPRIAPSGWQYGGSPCGCNSLPCSCQSNTGCPIQLDANCVIYHKSNDQTNNLGPIGLNNGATLQLFMDTVAPPIGLIMNVPNYTLPFLRAVPFTINNIQQFAQAVDTQFDTVDAQIAAVVTTANTPITPIDTTSIDLTVSGFINHTLSAALKISATANNQASVISDGLVVPPQTLSYNTVTKDLAISSGNTVSLASLACGVGGFLGNLGADPSSPLDGQYWFRTDLAAASGLRIRVNGTTRTIPTT